jgi:hypothetical protein
MNVLIWQLLVAVATVLLLVLRWQWCCKHHPQPKHCLIPVRREQRPPVPYTSRVGVQRHYRSQVVATRTIALSTLPMPIKGEIEAAKPARLVRAEAAPRPLLLNDLSFAPPDVALMRRVVEGLRALPDRPQDAPHS